MTDATGAKTFSPGTTMNIATVASVAWTSARVLRHLLASESTPDWIDPSAKFTIIERRVPAAHAGMGVTGADIGADGDHAEQGGGEQRAGYKAAAATTAAAALRGIGGRSGLGRFGHVVLLWMDGGAIPVTSIMARPDCAPVCDA